MLIHFSFDNWACFAKRVDFSMVASKERRQHETLARFGRVRILPIAALYGENAGGKTSFVRALEFAQDFVIRDPGASGIIRVRPCAYLKEAGKEPSAFRFLILADERFYLFEFAATATEVVRESLTVLNGRGQVTDKLYARERLEVKVSGKASEQMRVAVGAVVAHRLFLSVAAQLNAQDVGPVFDWFLNHLRILTPEMSWAKMETLFSGALREKTETFLNRFAAGTKALDAKPIPQDKLPFSESDAERFLQLMGRDGTLMIHQGRDRYELSLDPQTNRLSVKQIRLEHELPGGRRETLPMAWESDGTLRMLDLVPALQLLETEKMTIVVDELERSLHPHVCQAIVEDFLNTCGPEKRSQLIFTTHNVQLIGEKTLRKDEYWIVDRRSAESSAVYAFSDFKESRTDSDLLKAYNTGRMGGIPKGF